MEKKAKIIATLGPSIYSENKLKKLVELGVDAFRINFSHNTNGIGKIISKIRKIEKINGKKLSLIADLQGVKLRIGKVKNEIQRVKFNQKFTFDNKIMVWSILKDIKYLSVANGLFTPKKNEMIENDLIGSFKFLRLTEDDLRNFIKNKKRG